MPESREGTPLWRRVAGTLLFDGSIAAAGLGVARMIFGVAIELPPRDIPLGPGGPLPAFVLAAVLFIAAASLRPPRRRPQPAGDEAAAEGAERPDTGVLGPAPIDLAAPAAVPSPIPRHRAEP